MDELRTGWDLQHPRVDGTSGGWWLPLLDRQTTLILIPAEDRRTLQSFEPELWKPLAIDAPIIPYAFSGTPWATPGILQALQEREFVESGPWQYQPSTPWGNDWCVDLWGGLTGQPDLQPIRRQIEIFSSLGLPIAAARMVHGMRRVEPERFAPRTRGSPTQPGRSRTEVAGAIPAVPATGSCPVARYVHQGRVDPG